MRTRVIHTSLLLLCALAVVAPAAAEVVTDLYEAAVPVEDRSAEARTQAVREALARVLVRMTGRRTAASDPDLTPLFDTAERYLLQHGYTVEGELQVTFDSRALERALAELGQPIWGRERPLTLVWLAIDSGGGERGILGAAAAKRSRGEDGERLEETRTFLRELARERGVPIVLPLLDAEDMAAIAFPDVCGGFDDKIRSASARYRPDAVLVGCARPGVGDRLRVRWSLYQESTPQHWSGGLDDGLQFTADVFARSFATAGTLASRELVIVVEGLNSFEDYGRVLAFLQRLTLLRQVAVQRVEGNRVTFDVLSRAEPEQLGQTISLGGVLEPASPPPVEDAVPSGRMLHYRLRP